MERREAVNGPNRSAAAVASAGLVVYRRRGARDVADRRRWDQPRHSGCRGRSEPALQTVATRRPDGCGAAGGTAEERTPNPDHATDAGHYSKQCPRPNVAGERSHQNSPCRASAQSLSAAAQDSGAARRDGLPTRACPDTGTRTTEARRARSLKKSSIRVLRVSVVRVVWIWNLGFGIWDLREADPPPAPSNGRPQQD